ncbi:hypothetical protein D051_6160 [Vibrio parahaemolyticus VPCR-2010]|nr:hypothetical protein VPUCM_2923 [Vibrio parahaemolyticus UCM-V493]ANZ11349.1 hypothetical protein VpaChn25_2748 [Vibrio parahaemolyticus]EDM57153.1 hypothetical protein A79_1341 [Vibrio parahaemolyticus AQ3810]EFO43654.1 conserved hypothetical protein [Vibrio parahaemolyticus AN-5034]EQL83241.1 hypothetical protein D052_4432 [Vibrio parahaemolyticus 10290]EQL92368.1 hypothetical protein D036_4641 [Vibrio parahaemolyticus VP232]EQL93021.1 hypothetical protein D019_4491 [Vibrio parahaemolyti
MSNLYKQTKRSVSQRVTPEGLDDSSTERYMKGFSEFIDS